MKHFEIPSYDLIKYERGMGNGITNPLLMKTTDDYYVVKFVGNEHGTRILINEFVCYKLAKLLDIPIPDAALIDIDITKLNQFPELKGLGVETGLHFGSRLAPKAQPSIQPPLLNLVTNKDDIPSIILFDQIIYNNDRTENKGNLLIDIKTKRLLAIDHSHTFKLGALWNEIELKKIHEDDLCLVKDFHGHNYKVLLKFVNGFNPFNKILQKIKGISQDDIDWCFEQLPLQWELNKSDEHALKSFLWYRIENIDKFLSLLKEQCHDWKGGDIFEF
ncbi:hypothetical protein P9E76_01360 [Schinkia azotoformans]|uniref:HipA-like kinase domain-containing protein n=1 Tax=Schinkia azotoformans LMG 9581 TaxID=1131731 RepID=K6DHF8_SCHAZ|nr:HipA family kinase [Schinkia azotoformans]EKN67518.1 hypothetical protein BAZO_08511 [Schinkia azotoformans LMG 9581]MEC1637321.1 hypothetical protein [Schinkia azotoformans]MEC1943725.1 hypothetical protein [Schinkia azotoformans]